MEWWHWLVVALLLVGVEMVTAGSFFVIFFAVGALVVGGLALVGLGGPQWAQWLLFSFFSVVSLMVFRDPLLRRMRASLPSPTPVDALTSETAVALTAIPPGEMGRVELRGSPWSARNVGTFALAPGTRCRVVSVDGLQLSVAAQEGAA
jgi:hypothetical protein